jgi:SAM-dependent methyltransferase
LEDDRKALLGEVADYYSAKLAAHGCSPRGVDWNGPESQELRFRQLCRLIEPGEQFSINDLGCGYGSLVPFLKQHHGNFNYLGIDVSPDMVVAASANHGNQDNIRFIVGSHADREADYSVASGIFNVRLGRSDKEWQAYLNETLEELDRTSRRGFAFNCLTSYSDQEKMRPDLYYASPLELFDLCKRRYSRNVALLHDYELYEFTILLRKLP